MTDIDEELDARRRWGKLIQYARSGDLPGAEEFSAAGGPYALRMCVSLLYAVAEDVDMDEDDFARRAELCAQAEIWRMRNLPADAR